MNKDETEYEKDMKISSESTKNDNFEGKLKSCNVRYPNDKRLVIGYQAMEDEENSIISDMKQINRVIGRVYRHSRTYKDHI